MALSSPPTLQALSVEALWNRRGSSCYTDGHSAPSPSTEAREGVSWLAVSSPAPVWRGFSSVFSVSCRAPDDTLCFCSSFRHGPEALFNG